MKDEATPSKLPSISRHGIWSVSVSDVVYQFGTSGISVVMATAVTHPLDVLKVRLQMQQVGMKGPLTRMGPFFAQLVRNEGFGCMYLGLSPSLARSLTYGGLRLGLYEPSKYIYEQAFGSANIFMKIVCGAFSGATATALTNPVEVIKVRLQIRSNLRTGVIVETRKIVSEEGIKALWKGVGSAMTRAATLTASQLATYDESKQIILRWTSFEEGFPVHLISSTMAGIASTLITAPIDMIKTRLMLQQKSGVINYKNGFHCAYQVLRTEGPKSVYKGGLAIFARLCPQTAITFVICEKLRGLAGMDPV